MVKRFIWCVGLVLTAWQFSHAQTAPSPTGSLGIGQVVGLDLIQQESMGGTGIGTGSYWNLNNLNPAMLLYTKGTLSGELTIFQTGITHESRTISNPSLTEVSTGTNMSYLVTGFPVIKNRWFTVIGLQPYTQSNYNLVYTKPVIGYPEIEATVLEEGSGGINTIYMSHGVSLTKNISVGVTANLLFGSRIRETSNFVDLSDIIDDTSNPYTRGYLSALFQRNTTNGIILKGGFAYQDTVKIGANKYKLTLGAIYDLQGNARGRSFESLQRRDFSGTVLSADTLKNDIEGDITIPGGFGFGFSISNGTKWTIGIDAGIREFQNLEVFGENFDTTESFYAGIGSEITPNAFSPTGYLKRVSYRLGAQYEKMPYLINGYEVDNFGINFGVSLPIVPTTTGSSGLNKGFSSLDLGFSYGVQGNLTDNLLREEYFRVNFGVTFNDRWFVRRKYN